MKNDIKLIEIGRRIATQDNRGTAEPMFIVEKFVRDYGYDEDYREGYEWAHEDDGDRDPSPVTRSRLEALDDDGRDTGQWRKVGYRDRWEFVTACFSAQGVGTTLRSTATTSERIASMRQALSVTKSIRPCVRG